MSPEERKQMWQELKGFVTMPTVPLFSRPEIADNKLDPINCTCFSSFEMLV